jgi:hypothetical protein
VSLAYWRDLAIVLLVLEALILSLIPAALIYLLIRGMLWTLKRIRAYAPPVQGYFRRASDVSEQVSRRIAAPFISANATAARVQRWGALMFPSRNTHDTKGEV